jgi:hypothetical protein
LTIIIIKDLYLNTVDAQGNIGNSSEGKERALPLAHQLHIQRECAV